MKFPLLVLASLTAAGLLTGGEGEPPVTFIGHDKVAAALANGGSLVKASDLLVMGAHRSGPGHVELHEKETDVFYVVRRRSDICHWRQDGGKQRDFSRPADGNRHSGGANSQFDEGRRDCDPRWDSPLVQGGSAFGQLLCGEGSEALGGISRHAKTLSPCPCSRRGGGSVHINLHPRPLGGESGARAPGEGVTVGRMRSNSLRSHR